MITSFQMRAARALLGIDQKTLAELAGVSLPTIQRMEASTGNAYLIEINPRTTQVGHLSLGPGRDLPAALYGAIRGKKIEASASITERDTIALFPQEWKRDPRSTYLSSGYHDVPWQEPLLLSSCMASTRKEFSTTSQRALAKTSVYPSQVVAPASKSEGAA